MLSLTEIAGLHYIISATIGFCFGLAANYIISVRWVFEDRYISSKTAEFMIFSLIGAAGLMINDAAIYVGQAVMNIDYKISKLFATGLTLLFNFILRRTLLFRKE
jgi:putative flippase GtrA